MPGGGYCTRPVAALLFVLQLAGCTSWHVETLPPGSLIDQRHPSRVRVVDDSGKRVTIYRPEVRGDSLVGNPSESSRRNTGLLLTSVRALSTPHFNAGGTIGLVLGFVALVALAAGIGFSSSYNGL